MLVTLFGIVTLVKLLQCVNVVPLVGGVNRLLGLVLGLCTGAALVILFI